jgi:hypothetical protein
MGKIPYCGKETRVMTSYVRWTPERIDEVRRMMAAGMSAEVVAERLGLKRGSIEMALSRARAHKPKMVKNTLTQGAETLSA